MKYILTSASIEFNGRILYRIRAMKDFGNVRKGDIGGYIESSNNLSHEGTCWVYQDGKIMDEAILADDATVSGNAILKDRAVVYDNARVFEDCIVENDSFIYESAWCFGSSTIKSRAKICGSARIHGQSIIKGDTHISQNVIVAGTSILAGHTVLTGNSCIIDMEVESSYIENYSVEVSGKEIAKAEEERMKEGFFKNEISKALANIKKDYGDDL